MEYASTIYSNPEDSEGNSKETKCPHCAHKFTTGTMTGEIYCIACGEKFHPDYEADSSSQDPSDPQKLTSNASDKDSLSSTTLGRKLRKGSVSRFGDYTIIEEVARGGMGVVYKAKHRMLKRIVALKVLKAGNGATEEDIKRFMQEAKAVASLKHPNIVPIHHLNVHRGLHYFTMDYIEGTPLDRITERGPMPPYKACELIKTIAESIDYAHSQGIIHRDIKPANVIIDAQGQPMLTDFGLAVNLTTDNESNRMTKNGAIMGTIPYIPPEQAAGKVEDIGPLSDIYSLGALFYELLTGRPPFQGMTQYELLQRVINHYPPAPKKLIKRLSIDIDTIVMKCLAKEPERRYQCASDLAEDCNAFLHGDIIKARPSSIFYTLRRKIMRRPAISLMIGSLVILSLFAILVIRYARGTTQKLIESEAQHAKIQQDKNFLNAMLKRDWRGEFSLQLGKSPKLTTNINEAHKKSLGWYNKKYATLTPHGIEIKGNNITTKATVATPVSLPVDFNINLKVKVPDVKMGALKFFIGIDKNFTLKESTLIIELGVEGAPGAKIFWNGTTVAENGSFTLNSNKEHNITFYRDIQNQIVIVQVDNKEIMRIKGFTEITTTEDSYVGLAANGGDFLLQGMQISVRGMNQEMIKSSLALAESLANESKDLQAAKVLYEKVLKERATRQTILHAYNGYIKTLDSKQRNIIYECNALADGILQSRSRYLEAGEVEYLIGAALANNFSSAAAEYFNLSFERAFKNALKDLPPITTSIITNFPATYTINDKILNFKKAKGFPEYNQDKVWKNLPPAKDFTFKPPAEVTANKTPTKYYLAQEYELTAPTHILVTLDDKSRKLYINGKEITKFLEDKGRNRRYAVTDMLKGNNTVVVEYITQPDSETPDTKDKEILIHLREHNIIYTTVYGLLARIEGALLLLDKDLPKAINTFIALQNDQTLDTLKRFYPKELKARGTMSSILNAADKMLKDPSEYSTQAWILLEAARAISDGDDGNELAIRYDRLAEEFITAGKLAQARDLLSQAITLLPDWPVPIFKRAELLYKQEDLWYEGVSAFDDALKKLPNSLELRLQIATFFLHPGNELYPNPKKRLAPLPERAIVVAEEAVLLSKRKSPQALTLCAESLLAMKKSKEALKYIQEAILLENTPERVELKDSILKQLNQTK